MRGWRWLFIFILILMGNASAQRAVGVSSDLSVGVLMGTVTTPSGLPVSSAVVTAVPVEASGDHRSRPIEGHVDRDGTFHMRLPLERYLVRVQAPGFQAVYYEAAQDRSEAAAVVLTSDETEIVWPVVLPPVATLSGQVVAAESGALVSGGFVVAEHQTARFAKRTPIVAGAFLLEGLIAGSYRIKAEVNGYLIGAMADLVSVQVGDAIEGLSLSISEGHTFSGVVLDAQGQRLADAEVVVNPFEGQGRAQYATTGEDGAYRISGLEPGTYRASVRLIGYGQIYYGDTREADEAQAIVVGPDVSIEAIDFVLNPIGAIFGSVRNRNYEPLAGARIVAEPVDQRRRIRGRSDEAGHYALTGLPEGNYVVWAVADGYVPVFYDGMLTRVASAPVRVQLDAHTTGIDFVLIEGGELAGQVVDDATERPLANAVVTARRQGHSGIWQTKVGRDGAFVMNGLPDGNYVLGAEAPDYLGEFWHDAARADLANPITVEVGKVNDPVRFGLVRRQPADFDANGVIDFADLLMLVKRLGGHRRSSVSFDLNEDGRVDFGDFWFFAHIMRRAGKMAPGTGALGLRQVKAPSQELVVEVIGEGVPPSQGYALRLRYDPKDAEFLGAEGESGGLFGNRQMWVQEADGAILLFAFDAAQDATEGTGVLARLRFRPLDGTTRMTLQTDLGLSLGDGGVLTPIEVGQPIQLEVLPDAFRLVQNVPNPFNPETTIAFELPQEADVELAVYNLVGQRVRTLVRERRGAGRYQVAWDGRDDLGRDVSSGVYFYRLRANEFWATRRMLLVR